MDKDLLKFEILGVINGERRVILECNMVNLIQEELVELQIPLILYQNFDLLKFIIIIIIICLNKKLL